MYTGLNYNDRDVTGILKAGALYLGFFHGRKHPKEDLSGWGSDGPILGPITEVFYKSIKDVTVTFENRKKIKLNFIDGLVEFDGVYYGDWTFYVHDQKSNTKIEQETLPISRHTFENAKPTTPVESGLYLNILEDKPKAELQRSRLLAGPIDYLHTTYASHIRAGVNHPDVDAVDIIFSNKDNANFQPFKLITL